MKHFGRPFSVLTPEAVAALVTEFDAKPFNISARARALGVKPSALSYHIRGGKIAAVLSGSTWCASMKRAYRALRTEDFAAAARCLREAANRIEKLDTTHHAKNKKLAA
jgi:hypothetical protein